MNSKTKASSIEKSIKILKILSESPYEYKISDLALKVDMNRTTVHRIITSLENESMVIKDEVTLKYKLGPYTYHMGNVFIQNANYENNLINVLNELSDITKESVGFARRDGNNIISIYCIETHQPLKMGYKPGAFFPINKGCYGKCLMAYHDEDTVRKLVYSQKFDKICKNTITDPEELLLEYKKIKEQGYVLSIEETFPYAIGVGIPIFSIDGKVRNCVAISFFKSNDTDRKIESMKELLLSYSKKLTELVV
ncbi:MAG: IclR family transcriptional regulator [Sedimentibacter sp.]